MHPNLLRPVVIITAVASVIVLCDSVAPTTSTLFALLLEKRQFPLSSTSDLARCSNLNRK